MAEVPVTSLGTSETGKGLLPAMGVRNRFAEGDPDDGSQFFPSAKHPKLCTLGTF